MAEPSSFGDTTHARALRTGSDPEARRAFEALFREYAARLVLFAQRYVRSPDLAQDVVHDVFVWVWEHRQHIPEDHVLPYLLRAVRNRALNLVDHETVIMQWEASVRLAYQGQEPAEENSAELAMEVAERQAQVNRALAKLTPRVREIVRLNREEQLKPGEIAEVLGLAPATVYAQLSRALKQIAEELR